jgi:hypothetical protein
MSDATANDTGLDSDRPDATEMEPYSDEEARADEYECDNLSEDSQ